MRPGAFVAVIDKDGTAFQLRPMALQRDIDHSIHQRMTRADQRCLNLTGHIRLIEADTRIALQHGIAAADEAIMLADDSRRAGDLEAAGLTGT